MKRAVLIFLFLSFAIGAVSCVKGESQGFVIAPPSTKPNSGNGSGSGSGNGSGSGGDDNGSGTTQPEWTHCTDIGQTPIVLAYFTEYSESVPEATLITHLNYAHGRFKNPKT